MGKFMTEETHGWWASDESGTRIYYSDAACAWHAAKQYVDDGDWEPRTKTWWAHVRVWQQIDGAEYDAHTIRIPIEPEEPECSEPSGHEWVSGHVRGSGDGVSTCEGCGIVRRHDTWAMDPYDGSQGHFSVEYLSPDIED
jgi:hypothetical protein